jgi:hypothetical protein
MTTLPALKTIVCSLRKCSTTNKLCAGALNSKPKLLQHSAIEQKICGMTIAQHNPQVRPRPVSVRFWSETPVLGGL